MKDLKIGERVTITLEVVEELSCYGCFFRTSFGKCNGNGKVKCSAQDRSDGKNVIFKEVKRLKRMKQKLLNIKYRLVALWWLLTRKNYYLLSFKGRQSGYLESYRQPL